jgi:hypothetical protein
MKILEPFADPRVAANDEAEAEKRKRNDRVLDGMTARRLETYHNTGKWDAGWGPVPA